MTHTFGIVGMKYRPPAEIVLQNLPDGTPITFRREPSNAYDSNAIQIIVDISGDDPDEQHNWQWLRELCDEDYKERQAAADEGVVLPRPDYSSLHLGYIPKDSNEELAMAMDSQNEPTTSGIIVRNEAGRPLAALPSLVEDGEDLSDDAE